MPKKEHVPEDVSVRMSVSVCASVCEKLGAGAGATVTVTVTVTVNEDVSENRSVHVRVHVRVCCISMYLCSCIYFSTLSVYSLKLSLLSSTGRLFSLFVFAYTVLKCRTTPEKSVA